jgi:hypothetical protein
LIEKKSPVEIRAIIEVHWVPLKINVRKKISSENIQVGTIFLNVGSRGK